MKNRFYALVIFSILIVQSVGYSQFWVYQTSGTTQELNGVFMLDELNGWVCGDAGTLLKTNNGGQNWVQVPATGNDLNSIAFKDANSGVAVGDDGIIIRTTNGGINWNTVNSGTSLQFRKVSWGDGNFIFAAGDDGLAAVSIDAGASWVLKNAGTTVRFRGAAAAGLNKIWAVGEDGIIKYSADGGNNWITQTSVANNDLHDIQFISESVGFSGGSSSNFIFTNDGGQTWTPRNSGIFLGLNGIYFQDANIGWAVSDFGTIFFTTNGGTSWTSQPCGSSATLNEAYFVHQGKGWTVGTGGTIVMYDNPSIPVELNSFAVSVTGNSVNLSWSTATETNNMGFEVERKKDGQWEMISFVEGKGNSTELNNYSFEDRNLLPGSYSYRLKQIDFDGSFEYYELNSEVIIEAPNSFSLKQNYPNPFNPVTNISFSLPETGNVSLKVYNVLGNEVVSLLNSRLNAGNHNVIFDAINFSSGVYYYRIEIDGKFIETRQMVLLK
jgi:photosystem II stability/assembly factor-like uncharacterized protein